MYITHAETTGGVNRAVAAKLGAQYEQFLKIPTNNF
jgi:hypothetical protein